MGVLSNAAALLGKEVRTEFRSRELLSTTIVFVLIVVVLFSFTFDPTTNESHRFGPGLLWLAFLFAASLMLQPCFLREQANDTLSALRLAVSDPFAIFLAKIGANTLFLLLTELLMLPVFAALFNVNFRGQLPGILLTFFLGSLGISTAGTALAETRCALRCGCVAGDHRRVRLFFCGAPRTYHGRLAAYFLFSRKLRLGWPHRVFNRFCK